MSKLQKDFTKGSISSLLIKFSLPFLLSNFIQALYGAVDMVIVGNYSYADPALRDAALSGVNIGGQVTHVLTMMVSGLTVAGTVLVGQYFGARKDEDAKKTIGTMFSLLFLAAIVLTIAMIFLSDPLLRLLATPEESFSHAKDYLNICLTGLIFIFGYNAISSVQRGMGDSTRPMIFVSASCVMNIVLDIIFVKPLQMGAAGAALATVISQAFSFLLAAFYLARNKFIFDFKLRSFRIYADKVKMILSIGLPSSVQSVITNVSFLIMTALVNTIGGYQASAAVGVVGRFNSFAILPAVAMSSSVSAFTAQNVGARLYDRAKSGLKVSVLIALLLGAFVFTLAQVFAGDILALFTENQETIALGVEYMRTFSFDYISVPFQFCLNGLLLGAGHTMFTMANGVISSLGFRMLFALLLSGSMGLAGVGLAAPIATVAGTLMSLWFVLTGRWMRDRTGIRREE